MGLVDWVGFGLVWSDSVGFGSVGSGPVWLVGVSWVGGRWVMMGDVLWVVGDDGWLGYVRFGRAGLVGIFGLGREGGGG